MSRNLSGVDGKAGRFEDRSNCTFRATNHLMNYLNVLFIREKRSFCDRCCKHLGVCFADICPRPHRVSVDTGDGASLQVSTKAACNGQIGGGPETLFFLLLPPRDTVLKTVSRGVIWPQIGSSLRRRFRVLVV